MSNARRGIIFFIGDHRLKRAVIFHYVAVLQHVVQIIRVIAGAAEHTDATAKLFRYHTGIFKRMPRQFEQNALLRIDDTRFEGGNAKKCRIKTSGIRQNATRIDAIILRGLKKVHGVFVVEQILPKLLHSAGARYIHGHADDRDIALTLIV